MRILVIDDDEFYRDLIHGFLENEGFDLDFAHDGLEGVNKLSTNQYDVVILDIVMPRLDGYGVIRHMLQSGTAGKIIVITSLPQIALTSICGVLKKPFSKRALVNQVRQCAANNAAMPGSRDQ